MNKYVNIISKAFPDVECYSKGPNFSDVIFVGANSVTEAEVDAKALEVRKEEELDLIRDQYSDFRSEVFYRVLKTKDENMVSVYKEKAAVAHAYVADANSVNATDAALVEREATSLGLTMLELCNLIIQQHNAANTQILPVLGDAEAVRRVRMYAVNAATTEAEVNSLVATDIAWPDISQLYEV